ncbi:Putative ribonuclease H protein At1g65750 [Linum perenne]
MIWGPDPKGKFSIKSAYEILDCSSLEDAGNTWRIVWKWEGPSRIKHFLWLVAHERVLTNGERCRRHIAQDSSCYRCSGVQEDLLHVVRDCTLAREVWRSLFPVYVVNNFFTEDLQVWLRNGLQAKNLNIPFDIVIWLLWKARNEAVFEQISMTSDQLRLRVLHWITGVRETMREDSQILFGAAKKREEVLVHWNQPPENFITINTNGSVLQPHSHAAAGGILRDWQGRKLVVFAANLGTCSIMRAELRTVDIGLKIA